MAVAAVCSDGSVVGVACVKGGVDKYEERGPLPDRVRTITIQRPTISELALTFKDCDIVHGRLDLEAKRFTPHASKS
jgi:hypothetical protein